MSNLLDIRSYHTLEDNDSAAKNSNKKTKPEI
jgi:hypothetical protein